MDGWTKTIYRLSGMHIECYGRKCLEYFGNTITGINITEISAYVPIEFGMN